MISPEEVLKLAELARLKLTEEEIANLQKDISSILDYVGQLSTASIEDGGEKYKQTAVGVSDSRALRPLLRNVMRADTPASEAGVMVLGKREALVEAFPQKEKSSFGGFFNVVRKIIQKDE